MPENYDVLSFLTNWNKKLDCDAYTTFRPHNPGRYYVGKTFSIQLNKTHHHYASVLKVKAMTLNDACKSEHLCYLDTGYSPDEFRKLVETMYKNRFDVQTALFDLILLKKHKE